MILLRYCKTSNKQRKVIGYMQTLITHIHCVCFLVGVSGYRRHTSILIFLIAFCLFFHAATSGFQHFLNSEKSSFILSFLLTLSFTTSFIIFWNFSMFYQTFLSPQVKPYATFTYNHGMYELPHQLLNNLRLRILGNYKISGNHPNFIEW